MTRSEKLILFCLVLFLLTGIGVRVFLRENSKADLAFEPSALRKKEPPQAGEWPKKRKRKRIYARTRPE